MPFEVLLRHACKQCSEGSIRTYTFNIRSLARMAGFETIPMHSRWLNKALLEKVSKLTLGQQKKYTVAGVKALQAYDKAKKNWSDALRRASDKYSAQRNKQERTEREKELWPSGGYKALSKLAGILHDEVAYILKKAAGQISMSELYKLQQWFVILFYSRHALRGDLAEVQIKKRGHNYIYQRGSEWHVHIGEHKTSKSVGAIDLQLATDVQKGLAKFLPYVRAKTNHGYLLSTKRSASKMDRRDMMLMIRNLTEERLGKRLGTQMIRVLRTTDSAEAINEAAKLRRELGHSARTQFQYVSK